MELGFQLREAGGRAHTGLHGFSADSPAKEGEGAGLLGCVSTLPRYLCRQLIEGCEGLQRGHCLLETPDGGCLRLCKHLLPKGQGFVQAFRLS